MAIAGAVANAQGHRAVHVTFNFKTGSFARSDAPLCSSVFPGTLARLLSWPRHGVEFVCSFWAKTAILLVRFGLTLPKYQDLIPSLSVW